MTRRTNGSQEAQGNLITATVRTPTARLAADATPAAARSPFPPRSSLPALRQPRKSIVASPQVQKASGHAASGVSLGAGAGFLSRRRSLQEQRGRAEEGAGDGDVVAVGEGAEG